MNVEEMVKNVKAECHPITNIDGIIRRWLNRGQKVIQSKAPKGGWFWLRQWDYAITTANGVSDYALSPLVDTSKVINIRNEDTPCSFGYMTDQEFRRRDPGADGSGQGFLYTLRGFSPVQNQPSSASTLSFTSSSASDTTTLVNIQGLNSSSVMVGETVAMNGTSAVVTTNSYIKVLVLSKDATSVGTFTATSNSGAVTNVRIAPKYRAISHPIVFIYNIPDATDTLKYDFTMNLPEITENDDISLIPEKYHDAVELYAKSQCFKHLNNPTMAQIVMGEFNQRIEDMKTDQYQPRGPVVMPDFNPGFSPKIANLPSYFPSGS